MSRRRSGGRRGVARRAIVVSAIATAGSLAACGADDPASGPTTSAPMPTGMDHGGSVSPAAERPSTDATLAIVSPTDGEILSGDVGIRLRLRGARLVDQASTDLRPDEGHLHVVLDDRLISMTGGLEQTLPDVEPGTHLLKVEFVANDHAPFEPRVIAAVAFEVRDA